MIDFGKPASRGEALALALACLSLSACASGSSFTSAFSSSSQLDQTFVAAAQTWDIDKSGSVTCAEWTSYVSSLLAEADQNGDSTLDAPEFERMARSDRLFELANLQYYDANSDGRVTQEELTGKQNRAFALLDKNGDCQLDRNESVRVHGAEKAKASAPPASQEHPSRR